MNRLRPTLGLFGGTLLLLNIVIGAGLLVLPGLVYQQVGTLGLLAWLLCAMAAFPLLLVFIALGQRHPSAGGVAEYARRAFGPLGQHAAAFLFLGAVIFGLPSIALTGGYYLHASTGWSAHVGAAALIIAACVLHALPGQLLERALQFVGSALIAVLLALLLVAALAPATSPTTTVLPRDWREPVTWWAALAPFMMIFFAFTGWEVGSHAAEEFRRPERDFPRAMLLSFAIAVLLYGCIAWLVQRAAPTHGLTAPFVELTRPVLGENGRHVVGGVALLLILANLFGALWGVSRLVFSLARDGILPAPLAATRQGTPLRAIVVTVGALLAVLGADAAGALSIGQMLALAGQNFLLLYGMAAAALLRLDERWAPRLLALLTLAVVGIVLVMAGVHLAYPAVLVGLGAASAWLSRSSAHRIDQR
ncbi:MAG: APC family permease [Burkholderiales bacterium]|nr:APC family permease [Burkholderiales bacterium]